MTLARSETRSDTVRRVTVFFALGLTLALNYAAGAGLLFGRDTGQISDDVPNLFTPAGYVFAIWGLIYTGLVAYAIWQALPSNAADRVARATGWLFIVSCLFNSAWVLGWHALLFPLTMVLMLGLLGTLAAIWRRLWQGDLSPDRVTRWTVYAPFSLYLGWITVATIANATILLVSLGWTGGPIPGAAWSATMLVIGGGLAAFVAWRYGDVVWAFVPVWAFPGVALNHGEASSLVATTAWVMTALLVAVIAAVLWRDREARKAVDPVPA